MTYRNAMIATFISTCLALSVAGAGASDNSVPPSAPSPATLPLVALSPEFRAAAQNLSAGSYRNRQKAMQTLQQAFAELSRNILNAQTDQNNTPAITIMRLNAGFSLWLQHALSKADVTRKAEIAWGMQPEHLSLVCRAYSPLVADRLAAVAQLAQPTQCNDAPARDLLDGLLLDPDRDVYMATVDALWVVPPTADSVNALWEIAVLKPWEQALAAMVPPAKMPFHGATLDIPSNKLPDAETLRFNATLAFYLLLHYHSPLVDQKVAAVLGNASRPDGVSARQFLRNQRLSGILLGLIPPGKYKTFTPLLYQLAVLTDPDYPSVNARPNRNGIIWSSHTTALAWLVKITGQEEQGYRLSVSPITMGFRPLSDDDEAFALEKLKTWWSLHGPEFTLPTP